MLNFWKTLPRPILALAPMAGVTDSAFRQLCRLNGAAVVYSEMTSADALFFDAKKTLQMLKFAKKELPLVIQLFGKDPEKFGKASQAVEAAHASGIDINFGCPAKKMVGHDGGVTLMRDLDLCHAIIKKVISSTKLPVSVKLRAGISSRGINKVTAVDFLKKMSDLPLAAVMIHGRSYEQGFSGEIDYEIIKDAKKYFKGIILANGGVNTPADAQKLFKKTGANGLGIARGALGRPWLFKQIKEFLNDNDFSEPTWAEKKQLILKHAQLALADKGAHGLVELRKHLLWYVKGLAQAKNLRQELVKVSSLEEIARLLEQIAD